MVRAGVSRREGQRSPLIRLSSQARALLRICQGRTLVGVYTYIKGRGEVAAADYRVAEWMMQRLCTEQLPRRGSNTKLLVVSAPPYAKR